MAQKSSRTSRPLYAAGKLMVWPESVCAWKGLALLPTEMARPGPGPAAGAPQRPPSLPVNWR